VTQPLVPGPLARLTDDFPAATALAFVGGQLTGACAGEDESYVMRWPTLPGAYEPLLVLPGEAVAVGGGRKGARMIVVTRHANDRLAVTWLDVERSRKADLVTPGDLRLGVDAPLVLVSPDDRVVTVSGAKASGSEELLTLAFEVSPEPQRRWVLTGFATRWHEGRLVLLEPHGTSAWSPDAGTAFLGDAPPHLSPEGRWAVSITETGIDVRGSVDAIARSVALEESQRAVTAWLGERPVLGDRDAVVLDPVTLESRPLGPAGRTLRVISDDGAWAVFDDGEALEIGALPRGA